MTVSGRSSWIVGLLAVLLGLLFAAQGAGLFPYPQSSFMVGRTPWIWRGLILAAAGTALIAARRRR